MTNHRSQHFCVRLVLIGVMLSLVLIVDSAPATANVSSYSLQRQEEIGLPDFTVKFKEDGSISVAKIPSSWIPGLRHTEIDPELVARFKNANIQYIDLDYQDTGMVVLVNGIPMLDLHYDNHRELRALVSAFAVFLGNHGKTHLKISKSVLPLLQEFGVEITFEFPVSDYRTAIERAEEGSYEQISKSVKTRADSFARYKGIETIIVNSNRVGELTSSDFGFNLLRAALPPGVKLQFVGTTVAEIREKGITEIRIKNREYGLAIELNGQPTPLAILYLENLVEFAENRQRWRRVAPNVSFERFAMVRRIVHDVLNAHNVDIVLLFPSSLTIAPPTGQ